MIKRKEPIKTRIAITEQLTKCLIMQSGYISRSQNCMNNAKSYQKQGFHGLVGQEVKRSADFKYIAERFEKCYKNRIERLKNEL